MGNRNSSTKISTLPGKKGSIDIPTTSAGYSYPAPPMLRVDDIRPPIPWYQDDEEKDEFDWAQVQADLDNMDDGNSGYMGTDFSILNNKVPVTPRSVLAAASLMTGPLTNRPMITPSGRPISFVEQERTRSVVTRRSKSTASMSSVSIHNLSRRHNKPPGPGLVSFEFIDEHARKTQKQHEATFTALMDYLKQPIRYHKFSELMTARALIVWLAYDKNGTSRFTKADLTTPRGLLSLIKAQKITHTEAYAVLCREAGLQCVLIDGVCKPSDIKTLDAKLPGDRWTAVYVEGEWQLVHPTWICKGIEGYGPTFDDWIKREIQARGKMPVEYIQTLRQIVKNFINEDFFMPSPDIFILSNLPNDHRWELLGPEQTIQSREEFATLPVLFPAFFRLGLRLLTEPSFELYSLEGKCKIWIAADFHNAHRLALTYELHLLETPCARSEILLPNLHRQVIHCRHNSLFYFEISFPVEGVFKLDIYGGFHQSHSMRLCFFKLVCEQRTRKFLYLPYYPDILMWGPGPVCADFGLLLASKPTGIIKVYEQPQQQSETSELRQPPTYKSRTFTFHLHKTKSQNFEYSAEVYGYHPDSAKDLASPLDENGEIVDKTKIKKRKKASDIHPQDNTDYSFCVECLRHDAKGQLVINVLVPHEGEFALVINAQAFTVMEDKITKVYGEQYVICAYLLRTIDGSFTENVHQKLARSQLQRVMHGRNIEYLRGAIDKCLRVKISQHDDEIAEAQSRVEFLEHRKGIMDAIHRRNIRVVNKQLIKVSKYQHRGVLAPEIGRLFAMRKRLKRLQEFSKYIPELHRAGDELAQMENPPPEVHLTMGALFLLLEEPERYIESWEYIVHQLRSDTGRSGDGPIYKKMNLVAEMFPSKNTSRKILTLLKEYHFEQVKRVSVPAAKFYVWIQKVMAVLQDLEFHLEVEPDTKQITVDVQGDNMNQLTAPESKPEPEPVKHILFDKDDLMEEEI